MIDKLRAWIQGTQELPTEELLSYLDDRYGDADLVEWCGRLLVDEQNAVEQRNTALDKTDPAKLAMRLTNAKFFIIRVIRGETVGGVEGDAQRTLELIENDGTIEEASQ